MYVSDTALTGPDAILAAWQGLLDTGAHLHPPEIARRLDVSEAALVASRIGTGATRLVPDLARCLAPVKDWGRVLCAFSSHCGVHMPLGQVATHVDDAGRLILQGDHMRGVVDAGAIAEVILFVDRDDSHGNTRSLQFFDGQGAAVLKVFIFHKTAFAEANAHFQALTHPDQSRLSVLAETAPASTSADWSGTPLADAQEALRVALPAGEVRDIRAEGRHAHVTWRGTLGGLRFGHGMLHLHEQTIRSHLRLAPLTHHETGHGLSLGSAQTRILHISQPEDRS